MKRYYIGATALAATLAFAPYAHVVSARALSTTATRATSAQDDAPSEAEQKIFNRGKDLFTQGHYEQASAVFKDFLKSYPNSYIADLMLLWLGRSYIELGQLQDADQVAQRLRTFKDTPFVDIYESELQSAKQEAARHPAATVTPTPRTTTTNTPSTTVAKVTPTPLRQTASPRTTPPDETATARTNTNTPSLVIRGGGDAQRTRRQTNQSRTPTTTTRPPRINTPPVSNPVVPVPSETQVASNNSNTSRLPIQTPTRTPEVRETATVETPSNISAGNTADTASGTQGGFSLTIKQVPDLQLALRRSALAASPGQTIQLPLVVTNAGNKEDQFRLETDLPAEYQPTFSTAQNGSGGDMAILVTAQMARGANMEVLLNIHIPDNIADNQQQRFLIRAASQADSTVLKVADASLTVVAAALAASSVVAQETVMPGDTFTQRINVRNQGSATARQARADFVFNPDFELVSANPSPINYDRPSRTAIWSLGDLESRDAREITVTLRAVPDALAQSNRALGRGTMRTQSLIIPSNFDGPAISIGRVPKAQVDSVSSGLTATPGDTIYIPFIVRNPSNYPESYSLNITAPGAPAATIYADANGDGQHQDGEQPVTQTNAIDPRGGQYPVLLRVEIPRSTADRQQYAYNLVTRALASPSRIASEASTVLTVAAPRVRVRAELANSEVKPGDTIFYRLVLVNDGAGLAKNLTVTELLPSTMEFVSSTPSLNLQDANGGAHTLVWRVSELAPGDTSVLQVTVRLRANIQAGQEITPRHSLIYQDTNSNSHNGQ